MAKFMAEVIVSTGTTSRSLAAEVEVEAEGSWKSQERSPFGKPPGRVPLVTAVQQPTAPAPSAMVLTQIISIMKVEKEKILLLSAGFDRICANLPQPNHNHKLRGTLDRQDAPSIQ
jgi:hypothetical protein